MPIPAILAVLCLFYGGGFVLPFVYYRVRRDIPWYRCIVPGLVGFIFYFFLLTAVADLGAVLLREMPLVGTGLMILLVSLPYGIALRIFLKRRNHCTDATRPDI